MTRLEKLEQNIKTLQRDLKCCKREEVICLNTATPAFAPEDILNPTTDEVQAWVEANLTTCQQNGGTHISYFLPAYNEDTEINLEVTVDPLAETIITSFIVNGDELIVDPITVIDSDPLFVYTDELSLLFAAWLLLHPEVEATFDDTDLVNGNITITDIFSDLIITIGYTYDGDPLETTDTVLMTEAVGTCEDPLFVWVLSQDGNITRIEYNQINYIDSFANFPAIGIEEVLYVDLSTGDIYIWDGIAYSTAPAAPFVLTNGSGTTANGTAVDLGGLMTVGANIDGDATYPFTITNVINLLLGVGSNARIYMDSNDNTIKIGDPDNNVNGNVLNIDDANNLVYYRNFLDTAFFGINTAAPTVALHSVGDFNIGNGTTSLLSSSGITIIGDANGAGNATQLLINDSVPIIELKCGNSGLSIDHTAGTTRIGGYNGGNDTSITVDDINLNTIITRAVQFVNYGAGALTTDGSGNITAVSDERLKDIQGDYEAGLKEILNINPIIYKWTPESKLDQRLEYAGFSAQNVKENLPLSTDENSEGYLSLQDRAITCALVNSVRTLNTKIEDLQELCNKQQEQIEQLLKLIK